MPKLTFLIDLYNFVIKIDETMTDKYIVGKINYYLENEDKRQELIEKGIAKSISNSSRFFSTGISASKSV